MLKLHKMELFSFRQIRIGSSEAEQEAVNFQVEISIFSRSSLYQLGMILRASQTVCKTELHRVRDPSIPQN